MESGKMLLPHDEKSALGSFSGQSSLVLAHGPGAGRQLANVDQSKVTGCSNGDLYNAIKEMNETIQRVRAEALLPLAYDPCRQALATLFLSVDSTLEHLDAKIKVLTSVIAERKEVTDVQSTKALLLANFSDLSNRSAIVDLLHSLPISANFASKLTELKRSYSHVERTLIKTKKLVDEYDANHPEHSLLTPGEGLTKQSIVKMKSVCECLTIAVNEMAVKVEALLRSTNLPHASGKTRSFDDESTSAELMSVIEKMKKSLTAAVDTSPSQDGRQHNHFAVKQLTYEEYQAMARHLTTCRTQRVVIVPEFAFPPKPTITCAPKVIQKKEEEQVKTPDVQKAYFPLATVFSDENARAKVDVLGCLNQRFTSQKKTLVNGAAISKDKVTPSKVVGSEKAQLSNKPKKKTVTIKTVIPSVETVQKPKPDEKQSFVPSAAVPAVSNPSIAPVVSQTAAKAPLKDSSKEASLFPAFSISTKAKEQPAAVLKDDVKSVTPLFGRLVAEKEAQSILITPADKPEKPTPASLFGSLETQKAKEKVVERPKEKLPEAIVDDRKGQGDSRTVVGAAVSLETKQSPTLFGAVASGDQKVAQPTAAAQPFSFASTSSVVAQQANEEQGVEMDAVESAPKSVNDAFSSFTFSLPNDNAGRTESAGMGLFSGLGAKPPAEAQSKNVFAAGLSFASPSALTTASPFGSKVNFPPPAFASTETTKSSNVFSASGATGSSAFGSAPAFGGPIQFGQPSKFASASPFGSVGQSNIGAVGGFSSFASSNVPSFGTLANQGASPSKGFGSSTDNASTFTQWRS